MVCIHVSNYARSLVYAHSNYSLYVCTVFHVISVGEDGTPLACAASKGHVKVINYLLGQNVDVNGGIKVSDLK